MEDIPSIGLIVPNCPLISSTLSAMHRPNYDSDEDAPLAQAASYSSDEYSDADDYD